MTAGPGFRGARRRPVDSAGPPEAGLTSVDVLSGARVPLTVRPRTDVDLAVWASACAPTVARWLDEHGAILFSGFDIALDAVAGVAESLAGPALPYLERSAPRTQVVPGVYTSTDYPADQDIPLHNENSYQATVPSRLVFSCLSPATTGGATVLADCRAVLRRVAPDVVATFRRRGVGYLRNYTPGLGPSWQDAFQTTDRAKVEAYCRKRGITAEWRGADGLRTWQTRPAVATHPRTGEEVWFNHAVMFHPSRLDPRLAAALSEQCGADGLPTESRYGDGGRLDPEVLSNIAAAYAVEAAAVQWRSGDVLLVDNMLVSHGRQSYTGPRRVVVSLAGSTHP